MENRTSTSKAGKRQRQHDSERVSVSASHQISFNEAPPPLNPDRPLRRRVSQEQVSIMDTKPAAASPPKPSPSSLLAKRRLQKLRLEAIFHPKFENEDRSDMEVRRQMLRRVEAGQGYLEVTLKHSGSLLLWSGGQRYYSKNSTENPFTYVGEFLLRQHFARAWDQAKTGGQIDEDTSGRDMYNQCSDFVARNRLTLAFEVVTSVLGHHGSIPHRDFLILTAAADRGSERFLSTSELISMAQKFLLPHNDSWVFRTAASSAKLFELYDTSRETGLAEGTVAALNEAAEVHVCSMYPHTTFQGNILEGIVIRYVPYVGGSNVGTAASVSVSDDRSCANPLKAEQKRIMDELAVESQRILDVVPPNKPPCFVLASQDCETKVSLPTVLTTDVRELFRQRSKDETILSGSFEECLLEVLREEDGTRRRTQMLGARNPSGEPFSPSDKLDVPALVQSVLERNSCADDETRRIATLIRTLDRIGVPAGFKVLQEEIPSYDGNEGRGTRECRTRWLCVVHILSDFAFQKYHKSMDPGDMLLYRGFFLHMTFDGDMDMGENDCEPFLLNSSHGAVGNARPVGDSGDDAESGKLMLKMKFLPYMVRTFGCRNGLKVLSQSGPEAYDKYTLNLLRKWGMSQSAVQRWQPFFHSWGLYAHEVIKRQERTSSKAKAECGDLDLPPLSSQRYLDHLEHFSDLYHSGKLKKEDDTVDDGGVCTFRGLVIVVGLNEDTSSAVSDFIARELGGCRRSKDINAITEEDVSLALLPQGGGLVCSAIVEHGVRKLKLLMKKSAHAIFLVLFGVSEVEIEACLLPWKDQRKKVGMTKSWRTSKCALVIDLPSASICCGGDNADLPPRESIQPNKEFRSVIERIQEMSESFPKPDTRPGLLVFFPGIPGSGKSTLCDVEGMKVLGAQMAEMVSNFESNRKDGKPQTRQATPRNLVVRVGDKVAEKYWPLVKRERLEQPPCVYIADKNAPPPAWPTIGDVCAKSRAVALPVFPDGAALATTTIRGLKGPDGSLLSDREHTYPFSLHYLAVCISRVLDRPHKSHSGKLDVATDSACMVVVKFFCLYRNQTAEQMGSVLGEKLGCVGAVKTESAITIPFFVDDVLPALPTDLDDVLQDAVRLQYAVDKKSDDCSSDFAKGAVEEMEGRLRCSVIRHRALLRKLTVDEGTSRSSFVSQVAEHVAALDLSYNNLKDNALTREKSPFIKIVAIDIDVQDVHRVVDKFAKESVQIASLISKRPEDQNFGDSEKKDGTGLFITETHVTMAHFSQVSQIEMRSRYAKLEGVRVGVMATGILVSDEIAAMSVTVPTTAIVGDQVLDVPPPENSFHHITLWCGDGISSVESNNLPTFVGDGMAQRVDFAEPISLDGVLRYWVEK